MRLRPPLLYTLRMPAWPALLAMAALLALSIAFIGVMLRVVPAGEARRESMAERDAAVWRCNGLHGRALRDACVAALDPLSPTSAAPAGSEKPLP